MPGTEEKPVRLLLVGAGHANVHVLEAFGRRRDQRVAITLVTPHERTPYSGMLPGYLAGSYSRDAMTIDAAGLAAFCGAELHLAEVVAIDPDRCSVQLGNGECLAYDVCSLDIGSKPARGLGEAGVPVKPIDRFTQTVDGILSGARQGTGPFRLAVIGTGPAGVELAFAFRRRLPQEVAQRPIEIALVGQDAEILTERAPQTRRRLTQAFAQKGVALHLGSAVAHTDETGLTLSDGTRIEADAIIWATSSAATDWLQQTGLALDESGFVRVDETLRSLSHPTVFASGDIAALPDPRPKAGVFAVRQGPILAENLRRAALKEEPLKPYRPQREWLTLISSADGRAVADKWGISLEGRWVWRWKDWNDRRFVDRFNKAAARGRAKT